MSEVAEKTADVVAENVEEAIDGVVEVMEVVRNNPVVLVAAGVVGLAIGGAVGYFVAAKKLTAKFEDEMAEEIAEARAFYSNLNKVGENGETLTPQEVLATRHGKRAAEALRTYQGRPDEPVLEGEPYDNVRDEEQLKRLEKRAYGEEVVVAEDGTMMTTKVQETRVNIFKDDTFDLEEEIKYRTEDAPYIITHDEYFAGDKDYDMSSLTYYEKDDTLTDEHDKPLEETNKIVGDDHLVRFGSGSKDKNVVYVRNDRLGIDYEITRSRGSYLEDVLGMAEEDPGELKHSDQRDRRRAMRRDDG